MLLQLLYEISARGVGRLRRYSEDQVQIKNSIMISLFRTTESHVSTNCMLILVVPILYLRVYC